MLCMDALGKPLVWFHGQVKSPPFSPEARIEAVSAVCGCITHRGRAHTLGGVKLMDIAKRKRLESAGWRVGSANDFLGLSREEVRIVEMKLALSQCLRRHRQARRLTQAALARRLGSSQSRVAKLESGAFGVTLDLLFRALFAAGVTTAEIAQGMRQRKRSAA
jgi:DNA-binding XRE family transcriptional regulator